MNKFITITSILFSLLSSLSGVSQNIDISNVPFKEGEILEYDMYFKLGIIRTRSGVSSLLLVNDNYDGKSVFKATLYAKSSGTVKNFFPLKDTLSVHFSRTVQPLTYIKHAHEGKDFTIEKAFYKYKSDGVEVHTDRVRNDRIRFDTTLYATETVYDMLSILYFVRTVNFDTMERGESISVPYLSGKRMGVMDVEYRGTGSIKANDGRKYDCIELVMLLSEKAFENKNEAMRVYITKDINRVPIRVDTKLKHGEIRIILNNFDGLKY